MPGQARLDLPGLLHHVIARGVDGCSIFREDADRKAFVARLSALLVDTGTDCFAWALLPNHFHLVLRPNRERLATVVAATCFRTATSPSCARRRRTFWSCAMFT